MMTSLRAVVSRLDSDKLRALRRRLDTELLNEAHAGTLESSSATLRRIDVMTACSEELLRRPLYGRSELELRPVPWVEVDQETVLGDPNTTIRLQRSIRVF
jgi:hypothetical protein